MHLEYPFIFMLIPLLLGLGWWLQRGQQPDRVAALLRVLLISLLVLALARPFIPGTPPLAPLVVVVDQSASLTEGARQAAWQQVQTLATVEDQQRPIHVIAVGAHAVPLNDLSLPTTFDAQGTDLAGGLELAGGLLTERGTVVVVSDGGATTADPRSAARTLAAQGITIDVLPLSATLDVHLEALRVPPALRENERWSADIIVNSPQATQARLAFSSDGSVVAERTLDLQAGRNVVAIQSQAGTRGFHTFAAEIYVAGDAQPANNRREAWTVVGPPPRVLVVERTPDSAAVLRDQLEAAGLITEAVRPAALPSQLSQLAAYDSVVLQDISATTLSLDQQLTLQAFVRSSGRGLVVLGGSNSYSLGEYQGTTLEAVLPMSMEPPPRRERPAVALLLIIDRSASMLGRTGEDKFSLAKAAAIAATDTLGPEDSIGVLTFETMDKWAVEFTLVGSGLSLSNIQAQIAAIEAGGGTNIYGALETGLPSLQRQPNTVRHAVLFTDGKSPVIGSYESLLAPIRADGVTLSTIAIGEDADQALLESLAKLGAGRYHFAAEPQDLPRLTLQETEIARQNPLAEGEFLPSLATPHPAIRGLDVDTLPALDGYIATTLKADAEALLESPQGDVVLGAWQYGLGRVVAWTSDTNERWSQRWQTWSGAGPFWAQVVASTYADPSGGPLQLQSTVVDDQAMVTLDALDEAGTPINLAQVGVRVVAPDGTEQVVAAAQTGPGTYATTLNVPLSGTYQLLAALETPGQRLEARGGVIRSFPAEWAAQANPALLEQLAELGGGQVQASLVAYQAGAAPVPPRPARQLWPWLAGMALILWIVEIAWRRGWLERWRAKRGI